MKFSEAFEKLLQGDKICLPTFANSKYIHMNEEGYIVNDLGVRIPIDVNDDNWEIYEEMINMNFKEAVALMTEGGKVKLKWWKKGLYIELKEDGFYNQDGKRKFLDTQHIRGEWEVHEE